MSSLFEQSINQSSRCFACGAIVYAVEKKLTTHHVYHNRCFRCRICKRNLTGYSLNEEGDDIYCANCYRKKQRGDCNSFEFLRAAAEKAQYIHNRHHVDSSESISSTRLSNIVRETSRNPSSTLRQLERQYVSKFRRDSNLSNDESSSHSSPIFSPVTTKRTETIITPQLSVPPTDRMNDEEPKPIHLPTGSGQGAIEFRLNKSNVDLSQKDHRPSIRLSERTERTVESSSNKMYCSELNLKTFHRRSESANRLGSFNLET